MTERPDAGTTSPPQADEDTEDAATEGGHDPAESVRKARSDAASYRRRLREVEAERDALAGERDTLRGQVSARQRADVEALATSLPHGLKDGSDLWAATDLDALLDDDGDIDEGKVTDAVKELTTAKPHWAKTPAGFDLGVRGEALSNSGPQWADVLRGPGRRAGGGRG